MTPSKMPPIAILAGGLATRLRPMTEKIPKSLLEVAGEPFIAHQLRLFRRERIDRIVLCAGFLAEQIEEFVGNGEKFGVSVTYSLDGEKLMGTGGAIRRALPMLGPEFMVTYGDSYLDIAYRPVVEAFRHARKSGLMTVFHNEGRWDTSNVEFSDGRIIDYSKQPAPRMHHIDFGLAVLDRRAFEDTPENEPFDLASLYTTLVKRHEMAGFEVRTRFYEIGSISGLAETDAYIRSQIESLPS